MPGSTTLNAEQFLRYKRHLSLPQFGEEGQQKLLASRVLLVGGGGLGSPAALYLAAAGVGTLGLVEFDHVDVSNLQRQILYGTSDVGESKAKIAAQRIQALNPDVSLELHELRLSSANAMDILREYDVVLDGTDNFPTRYLVNDACVMLGKPNVHGSIFRFEGQATLFDPANGPCYRCLFPEPPPPELAPSCAEGGVLGVLPGMIAMIQATETLKLLTGIGKSLAGRLIQYDALAMEFSEFRIRKDPACPVCGESPTIRELIDYHQFCGVEQPAEGPPVREVPPSEVRTMGACGCDYLFLDVREPKEVDQQAIEGTVRIPLGELEQRVSELLEWKEKQVVVHCAKGGRSRKACEFLKKQGFTDLHNLAGGIEAWERD
jgi:molybdopterin/thiamine biosynthesis adenylyltransferase/rhodanese-related sulfurtransferase